jgi:hypothetical protein
MEEDQNNQPQSKISRFISNIVKKAFWDKGKPKKRGIALILTIVLSFLLKRKVYDRLLPSSEVMGLISNKDIKKVLITIK